MNDLKSLYIKKTKLLGNKQKRNTTIKSETKKLLELEEQIKEIDNEILEHKLPSYWLNLESLKKILEKNKIENSEYILQSCSKFTKIDSEIKPRGIDKNLYVECYMCTDNLGRFIVCQDDNLPCKEKCTGKKVKIFFKEDS